MAGYPTSGVGTHYGDTSIKEDVSQLIYQISPQSKPLYNMSGDTVASAVWHYWQTRELTTYADNAQGEGFTFTFPTAMTLPSRVGNVCQIFNKEIRVSRTEDTIAHHGIRNPYGDQMATRMIEFGTDMEKALMTGTLATGSATNAARRMDGLAMAIYSGITTYTQYAGAVTLGEDQFNDTLEALWTVGGEARDCLVPGNLKRKISAFTSSNTHFLKADERRVVASIGLYESDFFPVEIHLSRTVPTTPLASNATSMTGQGAFWVDRTMLAKAWITRPMAETVPKTADSRDGVIVSECTLEWGHRNAHWYSANIDKNGL